jgi:uncharacterized protein
LKGYVPRGTELDFFDGKTFVSLVGFRFLRTKLLGFLPLPFHTNFDEVNLRFYVRRRMANLDRRGVVFIREIVPKRAVALLARLAFGENYSRYPMRHRVTMNEADKTAEFQWQLNRKWCRLYAGTSGEAARPKEGSLEQFITEHYWGYSKQRDGGCLEYHVSHRPWRVRAAMRAGFEGDGESLYGSALGGVLRKEPDSAFIAEGSPVLVSTGSRI